MDTEITHAKHIAIICWNRLIHTGIKKFPYSSLFFIDWTYIGVVVKPFFTTFKAKSFYKTTLFIIT